MNVLYGLIGSSELLKERDPDGSYTFSGITQKNFLALEENSGRASALSANVATASTAVSHFARASRKDAVLARVENPNPATIIA